MLNHQYLSMQGVRSMKKISYVSFREVNTLDWLKILNEPVLRRHLVEHDIFNETTINNWVKSKLDVDAREGCRVRAIYIDKELAGWCGIQPDDNGYELAIVLANLYWGTGISIFKTMMNWAKELGHHEVLFHLLDSRREYKALKKFANKINQSQLLNRHFVSYYISVNQWHKLQ